MARVKSAALEPGGWRAVLEDLPPNVEVESSHVQLMATSIMRNSEDNRKYLLDKNSPVNI